MVVIPTSLKNPLLRLIFWPFYFSSNIAFPAKHKVDFFLFQESLSINYWKRETKGWNASEAGIREKKGHSSNVRTLKLYNFLQKIVADWISLIISPIQNLVDSTIVLLSLVEQWNDGYWGLVIFVIKWSDSCQPVFELSSIILRPHPRLQFKLFHISYFKVFT